MRFEDLSVWKRSARLSTEIYNKLGNIRNFSFRDQITRSGLSIPSNIAEGFERESKKECIHFLSISRGSCGELRSQIYIGININIIDRDTGNKWIKQTRDISKMLTGLMKTKRDFIKSDKTTQI